MLFRNARKNNTIAQNDETFLNFHQQKKKESKIRKIRRKTKEKEKK